LPEVDDKWITVPAGVGGAIDQAIHVLSTALGTNPRSFASTLEGPS